MKIFGYEFRKENKNVEERAFELNPLSTSLTYGSYSNYSSNKSLSLSAVYRSVNLISDAIASLQMKVYAIDKEGFKKESVNDTLFNLLAWEPSEFQSRYNFFKLIIQALLLRGNAYIYIERNKDFSVKSLQFINPDAVKIDTLNNEIKYTIQGVKGRIDYSNMIHIVNYPDTNSLYGVSTITYAATALDLAYNSEQHAANWFKGGANASGFLSSEKPLTPKQELDLLNKFKASSNATTGNPNGLVFMGGAGSLKLEKLGISPKDSQLIETRQYNVVDIARFFNVNPILLFDSSKGTYSNVEHAQLDFLNTTLLPIIEKLENEFTRKLILPSQRNVKELRFDLTNILRIDTNSQADYYTKLFSLGVMTANDIARKLNLPKIEGDGGNKYFISTNLQDSSNLIVNTDNSIDNKLLTDSEKNNNNE